MGRDFENIKNMFMGLYVNNRRYVPEEEISKLTEEEMKNLEYDSDRGE